MTDQYFNQNQTAQFANDLLAMGDDTTEAVVRGLTTPQNVRKMLTDPNSSVHELQTNLTGMTYVFMTNHLIKFKHFSVNL